MLVSSTKWESILFLCIFNDFRVRVLRLNEKTPWISSNGICFTWIKFRAFSTEATRKLSRIYPLLSVRHGKNGWSVALVGWTMIKLKHSNPRMIMKWGTHSEEFFLYCDFSEQRLAQQAYCICTSQHWLSPVIATKNERATKCHQCLVTIPTTKIV